MSRGLLNVVERPLLNPLARFLFDHMHQLRAGRRIQISLHADQVDFQLLEATARKEESCPAST